MKILFQLKPGINIASPTEPNFDKNLDSNQYPLPHEGDTLILNKTVWVVNNVVYDYDSKQIIIFVTNSLELSK